MGGCGRWLFWILCAYLTTTENAALSVIMRESDMEVVQGDFVTLPCSFITDTPLSRLNIIWTVAPFSDPDSPMQVIVYDHGQVIEDPSLTGRVGFAGIPMIADIVLNDTRLSDAGVYRCMVNNPPETGAPGIGELMLSVLAPPSLPLCQWDGDIYLGGSVTLTCMVAEGVPAPVIQWDKLNPEVSLPVTMHDELSASADLGNISSQTSGVYRCSVTNPLGSQNCFVNLSVYIPPGGPSGILQGVLLTLTMTLVLVALTALVYWLHHPGQDWKCRERKKEEECYNEITYNASLVKRSFV